MGWNHRVMRDEDGILTVREVYYNEAGEVEGWTDALGPMGFPEDPETLEPAGDTEAMLMLKWDLARFQGACCFPILDELKMLEKVEAKRQELKKNPNKLKLIED